MGGSYNPVHIAHVALADYICQVAKLHQVWLTLSPLNPLKSQPSQLIDDSLRLAMLKTACEKSNRLDVCDIELSLPRPSYTISTLRALAQQYPDYRFKLIIGSDNWLIFDRWKDSETIIRDFGVIVYPRPGYEVDPDTLPQGVSLADSPRLDISSTMIRESIARGIDMSVFLPTGVYDFIKQHNLYLHK